MSIEELKAKMEEWKLTLDDEPDYWDGVFDSNRGMYGHGATTFLEWLEANL